MGLLLVRSQLTVNVRALDDSVVVQCVGVCVIMSRVPTPPGKSWIFFLKIPGPGKSWKSILVLESPGKISLKITHFYWF